MPGNIFFFLPADAKFSKRKHSSYLIVTEWKRILEVLVIPQRRVFVAFGVL